MSKNVAIFDACVLYPAPLRDLLMHLAMTDLFRAKWSEAIHEEWIRSLLAVRRDLSREQLERTRVLMNAHVQDCIVAGYEHLIPKLTLPDPEDRHVLAAAIHGGVDTIVTFNLRDFPNAALEPYEIEAIHPDEFIDGFCQSSPTVVCATARQQRASLKSPPKSAVDFLVALEHQGLSQTVATLRQHVDQI